MRPILFLFFCCLQTAAFPQAWDGNWWGHVALRHSNGHERSYGFSFELEQTNKVVTGTSKIWVMGREDLFREMTVTGEVQGRQLYFREGKVLHYSDSIPPDWCSRAGRLDFVRDGSKYAAAGHIWGPMSPDCPQGTMRLYKVEKHYDTVRVTLRPDQIPQKCEPERVFYKSEGPCDDCFQSPPASVWEANDSLKGTLYLSANVKELVFHDYSTIDGDSVQLNVMGKPFVPAFGFHSHYYQHVPVNVVELNGKAIIMIALNEGTEPPCTVTMTWEDEGKKYFLDFQAGLKKGDGFLIQMR